MRTIPAPAESLLEGLNPEQRRAVTHRGGPLLVIAGPGTGKTRVLTHRIAFLIYGGVEPSRLCAVTFTNKAAEEMRTRLTALVGEQGMGVTVSTLHALAARILRAYADTAGTPYSIYGEEEQEAVIREALKQLGVSPAVYPVEDIRDYLGRSTNEAVQNHNTGNRMDQIVEKYRAMMRRYGAEDLDQLVTRAVQLCSCAASKGLSECDFSLIMYLWTRHKI